MTFDSKDGVLEPTGERILNQGIERWIAESRLLTSQIMLCFLQSEVSLEQRSKFFKRRLWACDHIPHFLFCDGAAWWVRGAGWVEKAREGDGSILRKNKDGVCAGKWIDNKRRAVTPSGGASGSISHERVPSSIRHEKGLHGWWLLTRPSLVRD